MEQKDIFSALYKRAMGYESCEVVEEYNNTDDNIVLSKRKVTKKTVPP